MKVTRLVYHRGVNLGDFEVARFEIEAELTEEDNAGKVLKGLKAFTDKAIAAELSENKDVKRNERGARV